MHADEVDVLFAEARRCDFRAHCRRYNPCFSIALTFNVSVHTTTVSSVDSCDPFDFRRIFVAHLEKQSSTNPHRTVLIHRLSCAPNAWDHVWRAMVARYERRCIELRLAVLVQCDTRLLPCVSFSVGGCEGAWTLLWSCTCGGGALRASVVHADLFRPPGRGSGRHGAAATCAAAARKHLKRPSDHHHLYKCTCAASAPFTGDLVQCGFCQGWSHEECVPCALRTADPFKCAVCTTQDA